MKTIPSAFLLLMLSLVPSLHAQDDSPLEVRMKILARGTRQLSQQVADPSKQQENVVLLEKLKEAADSSESLEPAKTRSIPQAGQASFLADYRAKMEKLKGAFDQVETALKAGDYPKAQSLLSLINEIKKEGHSKFKQD